jgi:hypothetical protein
MKLASPGGRVGPRRDRTGHRLGNRELNAAGFGPGGTQRPGQP